MRRTFLPTGLQEEPAPDDYGRGLEEQLRTWQTGVDGIVTANPDTGVVSRELFVSGVEPAAA